MTRTILIIAGGTGGHVFPGLAVADFMRSLGWNVVWMGARTGMEARLVPARGYRMAWIRAAALRGKGLARALLLPLHLLIGFWQSARAIFELRPDVVLGLGGYVAFPGGMMAALLNRPLAIHEQNAIPGLTNKTLARLADRVLTGFPQTLPGAHWTGNPVRTEIASLTAPAQRYAARQGSINLLVVGGSLGARALNDALPQALARLPVQSRPRVVHQSGERHLESLRAAYAAASVEAELVAFIDDMAGRYAGADLVICRAGALTIAELAVAGVASVLVPFPHAVDDHQTANARFLADRGAAVLLPQSDLSPARLAALLASLDRARLLAMAEKARVLGKPEATREVAQACMELAAGANR
ncbi:MAG: undecaprenyldiphospho-muramoylpentapeptide beta-N-acetylglucosaminyltransferase [Betaproteobacteria bacterium]|nr:undecaprenyldiphospho-muramoylpentapeptide beta-N-acetylglucosaminyltransferase [Betaproteobacteria bacterium]